MSRIPHALALTTAALLLSGCASGAQAEPSPEEETTAAASVSPSAAATTSPELEALATLETAAEEPAGFTEAAFGPALAGTDATGCDTFNAVLNRDLDGVTHDPRGDDTCTVFHGRLIDPYLDEIDNIVEYSNNQMRRDNVAVVHYVSLADAWASGAHEWDDAQRAAYANDLDTLGTVSAQVAQDRTGTDAAGWLPAEESAACQWAKAQVQVKSDYELRVDAAERTALEDALTGC